MKSQVGQAHKSIPPEFKIHLHFRQESCKYERAFLFVCCLLSWFSLFRFASSNGSAHPLRWSQSNDVRFQLNSFWSLSHARLSQEHSRKGWSLEGEHKLRSEEDVVCSTYSLSSPPDKFNSSHFSIIRSQHRAGHNRSNGHKRVVIEINSKNNTVVSQGTRQNQFKRKSQDDKTHKNILQSQIFWSFFSFSFIWRKSSSSPIKVLQQYSSPNLLFSPFQFQALLNDLPLQKLKGYLYKTPSLFQKSWRISHSYLWLHMFVPFNLTGWFSKTCSFTWFQPDQDSSSVMTFALSLHIFTFNCFFSSNISHPPSLMRCETYYHEILLPAFQTPSS